MRTINLPRWQQAIPAPIRKAYWAVRLAPGCAYRALTLPRSTREYLAEYSRDYSQVQLSPAFAAALETVQQHAIAINGSEWNDYSNALRREVSHVFEQTLAHLHADRPAVSYLEIGSCRGLSMSLIGRALKAAGRLGDLVSIDPYYAGGYTEGEGAPGGRAVHLAIDKTSRDRALSLYASLDLSVRLVESPSERGLVQLIREGRRFDLIYVDGSHEGLNPARDLGLCLTLLTPGGAVMLDDHYWDDVRPLKELMDKHAEPVAQCWKVVAYRLQPADPSAPGIA